MLLASFLNYQKTASSSENKTFVLGEKPPSRPPKRLRSKIFLVKTARSRDKVKWLWRLMINQLSFSSLSESNLRYFCLPKTLPWWFINQRRISMAFSWVSRRFPQGGNDEKRELKWQDSLCRKSDNIAAASGLLLLPRQALTIIHSR